MQRPLLSVWLEFNVGRVSGQPVVVCPKWDDGVSRTVALAP